MTRLLLVGLLFVVNLTVYTVVEEYLQTLPQ